MILKFVDEDDITHTFKQHSDGTFYNDGYWTGDWYDEPDLSNTITIDIESNPCMEIALRSEFIVNRRR